MPGAWQWAVQTEWRSTLRVGGLPAPGECLPHPHVLLPIHSPDSLRSAGVIWSAVIPAKAGIYSANLRKCAADKLDSRFRGNDRRLESIPIPNDISTHSALQEIQTFTGGRLAGITAKLTVRPEEATYFDRKEKRKKTSSIWALSLEVEGDDMRKLIANLTENARLFAETRKLLGSGGKVLEVVEGEQEQAPEVTAEFYPASVNGSSVAEGAAAGSPSDTIPAATPPQVTTKPLPPEDKSARNGGNGSAKPPTDAAASPAANNNGNGLAATSGFNQLRKEFLTAARRVATTKKQAIGEVVEWASGGSFKYGDIGRMTETDMPKLRAAIELMASALTGAAR